MLTLRPCQCIIQFLKERRRDAEAISLRAFAFAQNPLAVDALADAVIVLAAFDEFVPAVGTQAQGFESQ